jgi:RNA polymerase sigma factor (sigma-70 family)
MEERSLKNYKDSDYALNKYSEGIVYRFADGIVEITLADYLAENPGKTEADFRALKELSDADYFERDRLENAQTKKNSPLNELDDTALCEAPSPEDYLIGVIDSQEKSKRRQERLAVANRALNKLTEIQRRRYLMYHVDDMTTREIAESEGTHFTTVHESLQAAEKKIKKVLASS